jgi:REase_DpnII-MboI
LTTDFLNSHMKDKEALLIERRIQLLNDFHKSLKLWFRGNLTDEQRSEHRSYLNRNLIAVRNLVRDAGTLKLENIGPPPAIGGVVLRNLDPFANLFKDIYGISLAPSALESVEQAIGVYEHIQSKSGLINLNPKEAIDIESAIERALRPAFRNNPPNLEREVQDAIENILITLGIEYTRERESTSVGGKAYKPDFVIETLNLAIEVKLTKEGQGIGKIQEQMNADISAYRTKWKNLLFVIYDLGIINDPYQFRIDNIKKFGISVVVVKH